jgi:acyl carrier protein
MAHTLDRDTCHAHMRAKVHGFLHLQRLLPDTAGPRITLSSLSAVLGGLTLGPYAASNSALDAYALAAREAGAGQWITVDWDAWQRPGAPSTGTDAHSTYEITPREGIDIFERAIASAGEVGRLVISTGALEPRLAEWVLRPGGSGDDDDSGPREPRPALSNPYIAPTGPIETKLADAFAAVLRLEQVGVDDDFYILGGDSIAAMDLIARIRRTVKIAIPVTALLQDATVRKLAVRIAALD